MALILAPRPGIGVPGLLIGEIAPDPGSPYLKTLPLGSAESEWKMVIAMLLICLIADRLRDLTLLYLNVNLKFDVYLKFELNLEMEMGMALRTIDGLRDIPGSARCLAKLYPLLLKRRSLQAKLHSGVTWNFWYRGQLSGPFQCGIAFQCCNIEIPATDPPDISFLQHQMATLYLALC